MMDRQTDGQTDAQGKNNMSGGGGGGGDMMLINEPLHEKKIWSLDQVRHKPGCTVTLHS